MIESDKRTRRQDDERTRRAGRSERQGGEQAEARKAERDERTGEPNRNDRTGRTSGAADDADELIGTTHEEIKLPPPRYQFLPGGASCPSRSSFVPHSFLIPASVLFFVSSPCLLACLGPVFSSSHPVFRYRLVPPSRFSSRRGVSSPVSFLVCLLAFARCSHRLVSSSRPRLVCSSRAFRSAVPRCLLIGLRSAPVLVSFRAVFVIARHPVPIAAPPGFLIMAGMGTGTMRR